MASSVVDPVRPGGPPPTAAPAPAAAPSAGWIIGKWGDLIFLIGAPLLALFLGLLASFDRVFQVGTFKATIPSIFTITMAHLVLVFYRSHGNAKIFKLHPIRFTVVPIALFVGMLVSAWVTAIVAVVGTWWDVYHSSMQTFGIGRIYDSKKKNDPLVGRRLDQILNLYIYAGPILAGVNLAAHLEAFRSFKTVGSYFFEATVPAATMGAQGVVTWVIIATGIPFFIYYCWSYWRFSQRGYNVSWQKVALLVITAVVSIWTWAFNAFGQAFFIMNFFHAFQYFAIVWWSERSNLSSRLGLADKKRGLAITLVLFLVPPLAFGVWATSFGQGQSSYLDPTAARWILALIQLCAIMHFWYDGFIWSVRKKQV